MNAVKFPVHTRLPSVRKWLETEFQDLVRGQRAAVVSGTCRATGMSSTNGILTVLKSWNGLCGPDEVFSMGVHCSGEHGEAQTLTQMSKSRF